MPTALGAEEQTWGFMHARQEFHQLSHIPQFLSWLFWNPPSIMPEGRGWHLWKGSGQCLECRKGSGNPSHPLLVSVVTEPLLARMPCEAESGTWSPQMAPLGLEGVYSHLGTPPHTHTLTSPPCSNTVWFFRSMPITLPCRKLSLKVTE